MFYFHNFVKKLTMFSTASLMGFGLHASPVYADTTATPADQSLAPLEITPVCSDGPSASTYWQVNNKNSVTVDITWNAIDNSHTGNYTAAPGLSKFASYYDASDGNNTTDFYSEGQTNPDQTNATSTACDTTPTPPVTPPTNPAPTCIDGTIQQNLNVVFTAPNTVSVQTVNDAPLCADVTIDFSSYIMPADYDGRGFFTTYNQNDPSQNVVNPTAFPQAIFDNASATLAAGTAGQTNLTINLPDSCNNIQVDVYYAPEQTTIGANGSGTANIVSQIYPSTGACQTAPVSPTPPVTPVQPIIGGKGGDNDIETTAAITTVTTPGVLTNTGQSPVAPLIVASSLIVSALAVRLSGVRRNLTGAR